MGNSETVQGWTDASRITQFRTVIRTEQKIKVLMYYIDKVVLSKFLRKETCACLAD